MSDYIAEINRLITGAQENGLVAPDANLDGVKNDINRLMEHRGVQSISELGDEELIQILNAYGVEMKMHDLSNGQD